MGKPAQTNFKFEITYKKEEGKHTLTFSPADQKAEVESKTIEVTEEQWNALRYHFVTAVNDREKIIKLAYII